ncbi:MAG: UDP-N-acetylglucosamine 1-carboxyvinyltransferase [Thermoguttaceae bacterium]|jgi:UDP-N-acetylglucosamine 1-carboxyvinyltransferase|nr:UDP-N-acetylglucosamine 1-carboxyvinyltransferase [Thermoguttaceae bacterium]
MSGAFLITGGRPLRGSVQAAGSKNAALPMMAAALLSDGPVVLEGVPWLTDVDTLGRVLGELGVDVAWNVAVQEDSPGSRCQASQQARAICQSAVEGRRLPLSAVDAAPFSDGAALCCLRLHVADTAPVRARYELVCRMRASFCVLGPLLARRGRAVVPLPGGCRIGPRPVDLHLKGLAALGADLTLAHGYVIARARRLRGATIDLTGPAGCTVTGTANVLSAAVLARGETLLRGAACEPEIVDLGRLLCKMGARIDGLGTSIVRVRGVDALDGARHRIIPDRIEAATLAMAVAATRGAATITGVDPGHLTAVLHRLADAGAGVASGADWIRIAAPQALRPCSISAEPYPGIPSDVQAQWTALMTLASGRSVVIDRVFPQRFAHVPELARLGARIRLAAGAAVVDGVRQLGGATVTACDLRASAALVLAGLAARGRTRIEHIHWLDRGYEALDRKLVQLGASVERLPPAT